MFRLYTWLMIVVSITNAQLGQDEHQSSMTFNDTGTSSTILMDNITNFPETSTASDNGRILELDSNVTKNTTSESENNNPDTTKISNSEGIENTTSLGNDNEDVENTTDNSTNTSEVEVKKSEPDPSNPNGFSAEVLEFMKKYGVNVRVDAPETTTEETTPKVETTTVDFKLLEDRIAELEGELLAVFKEKPPNPQAKSKNQSLDTIEIFRGHMGMGMEDGMTTVPQYDFGTDAVFQELESKNEEDEKSKKERMQKISLGDYCTLATSHLCDTFPRVTCQRKEAAGGIQNYICACSHLHTQHYSPEKGQYCVANVFTPCSDLSGDVFPCGENMKCQEDSLGIDGFKYCRCLPGFVPEENEDSLPAFCIRHNATVFEDIAVDYQSASFSLSPISSLLFTLALFSTTWNYKFIFTLLS